MAKQTYLCNKCHQVVEYESDSDLYEVVMVHQTTCTAPRESRAYPKIEDIVPPEILKGNLISLDDIVGKYVLVTSISWEESSYKEDSQYLSLTVEVDGEEKTLNTGAQRVIQVFKVVKETQLPVFACFERIQLPTGRRVYRIKSE